MNSALIVIGLLASLLVGTGPPAPVPLKSQRVVVFDLQAPPEQGPLAHRMTDRILLELGKRSGITAVGETEIRIMVEHSEDKKELSVCESAECLEEIKRATEADKLITGHLGPWGDGVLVTLTLTDVAKKVVERGESATGDSEEEVGNAIGPALDRLLSGTGSTTPRPEFALDPKGTKVAVLELAAHGATAALAGNLSQLLALELKKVEGLSVISRDEIKAMLEFETEKQLTQCKSDMACLREIGGALGVQYLVTGAVGLLEDTYVIHLKLMDVEKAEVVRRSSESYRGPERHLNQTLRFAIWDLLGISVTGVGEVAIAIDESEGASQIDGADPVKVPGTVASLAVGKHALSTLASGYHPHFQEFYVEPNALTKVRLDLVELPPAWYEQWWPWAIIAGGVVAATTVTAVLATRGSDDGQLEVTLTR
jgi:TolB-like protein